ncbi:MAG: phosphopantothenoylcysteine decarboxylase [Elusimicrobiota bacterium]|jgi:phosphopantothenoylcysteine decarboxylase/phosphopantothenate--cysteine ligase|nr:phosphopantothenoylcysteine decarboxylase [Elusimicrobiota bacterium]
MDKSKNIILGISASIAAYKACDIIRAFIKRGANIDCILTKNAANFITPLTLQTLSKNKVWTDMFEKPDNWDIEHIALAKKADIIIIAPASANAIARLAAGMADDMLTSVVLASKAKVIICPAMNTAMYEHKATVSNIAKLIEYGYKIIEPQEGALACCDTGKGRLAPTDQIIKEALS